MIEIIALPGWKTPPTSLDDWVKRLQGYGLDVTTVHEAPGATWVEVASLRLRGYAILQGTTVEAINFELHSPDPATIATARLFVERAAAALGWEIDDEPDDGDND